MIDSIAALYEATAAAFDSARGRGFIERAWLDRFTSRLDPGASILDLGCGGAVPIGAHLAGLGFHLTGVDSSPTMIGLCRTRLPEHEWIVGDMRAVPEDRQFDGLLAWHSYFHLPPDDQRLMIARFADLTKAGGALMFTTGPEAGEEIGEWMGHPLYHASLSREEYRSLLEDHGFHVVNHVVQDPECGGATIWLATRRRGAIP